MVDIEDWRNPPVSAYPMVRWWWPGGDVTDEELKRELRLLKDAGIGGVEIQPFKVGVDPNLPAVVQERVNQVFTPEWFKHVKQTIAEAERLEMIVDITFGSAWPFGGPHIPVELSSQHLVFAHREIEGPAAFEGEIPLPETRSQESKLVAVVAVRGSPAELEVQKIPIPEIPFPPIEKVKSTGILESDSTTVLTEHVEKDWTLRWEVPPGKWQLFTFLQEPTGQMVLMGGGSGPGKPYVLDHLKEAALDKHIQVVGEEAKNFFADAFGKTFRAIFCDSLEVTAYLWWTDGFLEEFRRRRGYDLVPYLPILRRPGYADCYICYDSPPIYDYPDIGELVRYDYWRTVSELMIEEFFRPFVEWANRNSLKARIQAHGSPADVLQVYGLSDIPETESLFCGGRYDFLKYASSAAHVYGRRLVSSESFVWMFRGFDVTPAQIKAHTDELITAGANQIIYHGFPYDYEPNRSPGWSPFNSRYLPFFTFSGHYNPQNIIWPYMHILNKYISRLQAIAQNGQMIVPIALYHEDPEDFPFTKMDLTIPLPMAWQSPQLQPEINNLLLEQGFNFDFINEDVMRNHAKVVNGKLVAERGEYQALVIFGKKRLSIELVRVLSKLAQKGLPILFVQNLPKYDPGYLNHREKSREIQKLLKSIFGGQSIPDVEKLSHLKVGSVLFVKELGEAVSLLANKDKGLGIVPSVIYDKPNRSIFTAQFRLDDADMYFLRNGTGEPQSLVATFPDRQSPAEIWNPWDGSTAHALVYKDTPQGVAMNLSFYPFESRLIVFPRTKAPAKPHVVDTDYEEIRREGKVILGIARKEGRYYAELSSGDRTERVVTGKDLPSPAEFELTTIWKLVAKGVDKNRKPYTIGLTLDQLSDWTMIDKLRYFSGQGRYVTDFTISEQYFSSSIGLTLDLGNVRDVAEVQINGQKVGILLMDPYQVDVTSYLKPGKNRLEIMVTNTPQNRLVGDGLSGDPDFVIYRTQPRLLSSGLIGPVRITSYAKTQIMEL